MWQTWPENHRQDLDYTGRSAQSAVPLRCPSYSRCFADFEVLHCCSISHYCFSVTIIIVVLRGGFSGLHVRFWGSAAQLCEIRGRSKAGVGVMLLWLVLLLLCLDLLCDRLLYCAVCFIVLSTIYIRGECSSCLFQGVGISSVVIGMI